MRYTRRKDEEKDEYSTYGREKTQKKKYMLDALKDIFGPMFEAMIQGEMEGHLGYGLSDHGYKDTTNRRNEYSSKTVETAYEEITDKVLEEWQS